MTPTVADTASSPDKISRRHTDPPGLWIAVVVGSVGLHLLAFWLIRSYQFNLLWQQQSKAEIPIEFVDIAAQPKSKTRTKPAASKPSITTKKLPKQVVPIQKLTAKPEPIPQDQDAIALAQRRQLELAAQQQREIAAQKRELAEQQRELAQRQQRALDEKQQRELAQKQKRELAERQQRELDAKQQRENAANTGNPKPSSSDATGGSLIASVVGQPQQGERDRHTHPAKIKQSNRPFTKGLEYVKFIEKKPGEPVELTAILTISEKGKLEKVAIADQAISAEERSYYEDFVANEVLKNWEFEPAYDNDPKDPKPSNLTVRIQIQSVP